jgi:hypothetical protein
MTRPILGRSSSSGGPAVGGVLFARFFWGVVAGWKVRFLLGFLRNLVADTVFFVVKVW